MATIKVKDADSLDLYYDVLAPGSSSEPHQAVIPDYRIPYAIAQIFNDDAVTVSVAEKAKSLIKFGQNDVLASGVAETVWLTGGDETYKTANDIDIVTSTSGSDTGTVQIEGHTISGSDFTFVTQSATLTGTGNTSLTTPLARATRIYNTGSSDFVGTVTVEDNGTSVHLTVSSGNQSRKCATTISSVDYWIVTRLTVGVERSATATVDFEFQIRESGGVFRTISIMTATNGSSSVEYDQPLIVPPNSDVRVRATSNAGSTSVNATIHGYLAIVT